MKITEYGSCMDLRKDFKLEFSCCDSCHDDHEELGIEMMLFEHNNKEYHVCCRGKDAYENKKTKANQT